MKHPWVIIACFFFPTVFFLAQLPKLTFQSSIYDLIIEDTPESEFYTKYKKKYGSEEIILIAIKTDGVFKPENFAAIERIAAAVSGIEGVSRVDSLPGIKGDIDLTANLSLSEFEKIITPVDFFQRNFVSADHRQSVIVASLEAKRDKTPILKAIEAILDRERNAKTIYQIGMPLVEKALADYTRKDFIHLPPLTFALMAGVLFLLFRKFRWVLLTCTMVGAAIVWTFGMMAFTETPLTLLTIIVPIFLIAVGTAYCMHILSDYLLNASQAASPRAAAVDCMLRMGLPTALAIGTTIVSLAALTLNRIQGVQDFAFFSCFGIFSMLFILLGLLPAIMALLPLSDNESNIGAKADDSWIRQLLNRIIEINLRFKKPAIWVMTGVFGVAAIGFFNIRVETNPVDFFKQDTQISRNFHDVYQEMAGSFPIHIVLNSKTDGYFEKPEHLEQLLHIQSFLTSLEGVDTTISFSNFIKLVNYATNRYQTQFYAIPEEAYEVRMLMNSFKSLLGPDMFNRFMNLDVSETNIILRTHLSSSRDFLRIKDKITHYLQTEFGETFEFHITGLAMVIAQSSHQFTISQTKSLAITLGIIFAIMLLLFLSGKVGVIAIVANLFPICLNFGVMGWLGIDFSVATSLVASVAIGLAVDDTIHYLVRYNREFKKDLDKDRALRDTIHHVGVPIVFTSVTIALGFSLLIFSHFEPTSVYGFLMVVTMVAALVGDLILLPAVMLHVELITAWDLLRLLPSLGGLPSGITHELNQPLNAIKMGSELLKMIVQEDKQLPKKEIAQIAEEISAQVDRTSEIIWRLSEFGQKPALGKTPVDINIPIRRTLAVVESQLRLECIRCEIELAEGLPRVMAHENRLAQVVYNLIMNSLEAILRRAEVEKDFDRFIRIQTSRATNRIVLSISDSGDGIADYIKDRVFEPFFTAKSAGKGKGLGLSIAHEIIKDYGGSISVDSRTGEGTTFVIEFWAGV